jgi:hypothetical protein
MGMSPNAIDIRPMDDFDNPVYVIEICGQWRGISGGRLRGGRRANRSTVARSS